MGYLREGDHLVVVAVDRLGRSVREVATALHELTSRGVHVRSLREGVDTSTPTRAVTSIMATIAELELELGKERRAASREARVARGLAATKPMKLDAAQQKRLLRLYQHGEPVSELTTLFGISRSTLFRTLKVLKQQPAPVSLSQR
jgi:DNA invertase Pin-like site-specific DNA recombinase